MIKLSVPNKEESVKVKSFLLAGGEVHVDISDFICLAEGGCTVKIDAKIKSSNDLMELLLTLNAIKHNLKNVSRIVLYIPYLPYARQDRVSASGVAFGLEVIMGMIKGKEVSPMTGHGDTKIDIYTIDIHSKTDVTSNVINIPQHKIVKENINLEHYDFYCFPDIGAYEKSKGFYPKKKVIILNKKGDPATGYTSSSSIVKGKHISRRSKVLIIDDICDDVETFKLTCDILFKQQSELTIDLYVTHGIFSKGVDVLYESGIGKIYTTNSWTDLEGNDKLEVIKVI